ncbi:nitroreductase family protein [Candidatus Dependentiae bacterium]|nr:nitroreductase family protein [Candidatus Dependentiae bacterium]
MSDSQKHYHVVDLLKNRWSPRAMSGESLEHEELLTLFEAARWAPSSYNHQPWRFVYATRTMPEWEMFLNLMVPFNREWAQNAAVALLVLSHKIFEYNNTFSRTHSFDTGAATQNLALQGFAMDLVVHGIEGFDYDKARIECEVPDSYDIQAMFVVGKKGPVTVLPLELQKREIPSDRLKTEELIFKGKFGVKD